MPSAICPYLGLIDDPDTCLAFPTERNSCQRTVPVESISLEHQSAYCLTYKYTECSIYMGKTTPAINADRAREKRNRFLRQGCVLIWLAVVVVGVVALIPILNNYQKPDPTNSPHTNSDQVLPVGAVNSPTGAVLSPSPTLAPALPTVEPSPTKCLPPAGWVPYVLTSEDNVLQLAQAVGYSIEGLQQANCGANLIDAQSGKAIFLPYIPTTTPDSDQLFTPTNTVVSIIIIQTSTPTPSLTPVPATATTYVQPTSTKPPKNNPPSATPPDSRP